MKKTHHWVVGILIRKGKDVVLIEKRRPSWMHGYFNCPGGNVERGETPMAAVRREFLEETGLDIKKWKEYALLKVQDGSVRFFVAHSKGTVRSMTDEKVAWCPLKKLPKKIMSDLRWLLPLALDPGTNYATISYTGLLALKKKH